MRENKSLDPTFLKNLVEEEKNYDFNSSKFSFNSLYTLSAPMISSSLTFQLEGYNMNGLDWSPPALHGFQPIPQMRIPHRPSHHKSCLQEYPVYAQMSWFFSNA